MYRVDELVQLISFGVGEEARLLIPSREVYIYGRHTVCSLPGAGGRYVRIGKMV